MDPTMLTPQSLAASFSLVVIALFISYREKLKVEKELFFAVVRMIIQLAVVGFALTYIFQWDKPYITVAVAFFMALNAARAASQRGRNIPGAFRISLISIMVSSGIAMTILLLTGGVKFIPQQVIPINGMMLGSGLSITGLSFKNLSNSMASKQKEITEKLALGASVKQASMEVIRESIKISLQPTIDTTKTVGLVTLPGMMTGMIFSGTIPLQAIMYQIMIYFMISAVASITAVLAAYQAYPTFFNEKGQLKVEQINQ